MRKIQLNTYVALLDVFLADNGTSALLECFRFRLLN